MRFLLLNQTFYPDVASTAQHLMDLALALAERGHQVTVVSSERAYDSPRHRFAKRETWRGIQIYRVGSTGFGKNAKWRRAADFASFLLCCCFRLARLPKHDAVVAMTSPPLISFLGAWRARFWRASFFYWVMDFNPDEAIAAGWLKPGSPAARVLEAVSLFSLRRASRIIALDQFMGERILAKGIPSERVVVIPPWSHDQEVRFDGPGRERFRQAHGLNGKFVVMYSGNHSPVHPLDTLLRAAEKLRDDPDIVFCFVGGGSEWWKIQDAMAGRPNVVCLPYQPLDQLAGSLSAADLHVVVMGAAMVGLVHPCKIYNILSVGAPVLYIGPRPSHLAEILDRLESRYPHATAGHGEVERLIEEIRRLRTEVSCAGHHVPEMVAASFSQEALVPKLMEVLESK